MATATRAAAPARRPAPPAPAGVNFGELEFYSGGFLLPEGDYALYFDVRIHAYTKGDGSRGQEMLGAMVTAYPLAGGDPHEQFIGFGRKAIQSFAPDADAQSWNQLGSTGIVPIPGGPSATLAGMTNWNLFLKSLYDCGLPAGTFTNDVSVLDGMWVHTKNIPEPEERKGFGQQTGEVQEERRAGLVPVVTEIFDDGKPWEGTGGLPEGAGDAPAPKVAAPVPVARRAAPAPAARPTPAARPAVAARPTPARRAAPAAAPVEEEAQAGDADVREAAVAGLTSVLTTKGNEKGMTLLKLRTQTFTSVKKVQGEDVAQAVVDQIFEDPAQLGDVLGDVGYALNGANVAPA